MKIGSLLFVFISLSLATCTINANPNSFLKAVERSDTNALEKQLSSGFSIDTALDDAGNNALHLAVLSDKSDVANFLIKKGINLNAKNKAGKTPFHLAVQQRNSVIRDLLEKSGANPFSRDINGLSPVDIAAGYGLWEQWYKSKNVIPDRYSYDKPDDPDHNYLLEAIRREAVPINGRDSEGTTLLMVAVFRGSSSMVDLLLSAKANVNEVSFGSGITALHIAAMGLTPFRNNSLKAQFAEKLIRAGAVVNAQDRERFETPLYMAASYNLVEVSELLVNYNADLNLKNHQGMTPLMVAAEKANIEVLELLVNANADVNAVDYKGWTALHYAAKNQRESAHGIRTRIVGKLIEAGALVDSRNEQGATPLHIAAEMNNKEVALALLNENADVVAITHNGYGHTPEKLAMNHGHRSLANMLATHAAKASISPEVIATPKPADNLDKASQIERLVGPLVSIPKGCFVMGGSNNAELPAHSACVKAFRMMKYEVTYSQYEVFAVATGRSLTTGRKSTPGNHPIINVSWNDAVAFAQWVSEQSGTKLRLPSETEWEYAARAGSTTEYWWGNDLVKGLANCADCDSKGVVRGLAPVGSFAPNPWGLHDMTGNVSELVEDCWHDSYHDAPSDGSAWTTGSCEYRVIRGGSWAVNGDAMRSADRNRLKTNSLGPFFGFRLVQEI